MAKIKQIETVVVQYADYIDPDFHFPSKFVFRNALGEYIFVKTSKRAIAEKYVQENYGGVYSIREV